MNRKKDIGEMELNSIDRILASEEPLIPSLGFLDSVMERVREEAAAPPPIPFPWKRALPAFFLPPESSAGAPSSLSGTACPQ